MAPQPIQRQTRYLSRRTRDTRWTTAFRPNTSFRSLYQFHSLFATICATHVLPARLGCWHFEAALSIDEYESTREALSWTAAGKKGTGKSYSFSVGPEWYERRLYCQENKEPVPISHSQFQV